MNGDSSGITRLTDNVIIVSRAEAERANGELILDGTAFCFFRSSKAGAVLTSRTPSQLTQDDIRAINEIADRSEGPLNRRVKKLFARSLTAFFGDKSNYTLYEVGPGQFPLPPYFPEDLRPAYRGIEIDDGFIAKLREDGYDAMNWRTAVDNAQTGQDNGPRIGAAVYALHFMAKSKMVGRLGALMSDEGFFTGNLYLDRLERKTGETREHLLESLEHHGLNHIVIDDPRANANQFWVIYKNTMEGVVNAHDYARTLTDTMRPK